MSKKQKKSKKKSADIDSLKIETKLVHAGTTRSQFGETSEAIFLNSGYTYESAEEVAARFRGDSPGFVYSRFGNPSVEMFEKRMSALEGAEAAKATATGMAAIHATLFSLLSPGDHVVSASALFGSSLYLMKQLLPRFGIETTLVDGRDLDQWREAIRPNTKIFFLETPTNPTLELVDIEAVSQISRKNNILTVIDNVFATPILQRPIDLGADIVIYSATKHIDGQGRCMGGVVLGRSDFINNALQEFIRQTGPSLSPFNAWVLFKGLETLDIRIQRQTESAAKLVEFLQGRPEVSRLYYPGHPSHPQYEIAQKQMKSGGGLLAFDIKGEQKAAFRFINALEVILNSNNLGDVKSLITHPATTTHHRLKPEERAKLGIGQSLLRLSVGIENVEDLKDDLEQAFKSI